ncbi:PA3496 family putative envelope integrity protein [Pseudomonadota bacterium]
MAEDIAIDDEAFDDVDDEMPEDQEEIENKEITAKTQSDARRRVEQLREEKALERLLNDDYYDFD